MPLAYREAVMIVLNVLESILDDSIFERRRTNEQSVGDYADCPVVYSEIVSSECISSQHFRSDVVRSPAD